MSTNKIRRKDSRLITIEKYLRLHIFLTFFFLYTNIIEYVSTTKIWSLFVIIHLPCVSKINQTNQFKFFNNKKLQKSYEKPIPQFLLIQLYNQYSFYYKNSLYIDFLHYCNSKDISIYKSTIYLQCSFCGKIKESNLVRDIHKIINKKYAIEYFPCSNSACIKNHKRKVIEDQYKLGECSANGNHQMPVGWYYNHKKACKKVGEKKRGKTIDELYGKEVADKVREAVSLSNKNYYEKYGGRHTTPHTKEAKRKMRIKRIEFLNSSKPLEKKFYNPYNNSELVNWFEYNSLTTKFFYDNLSNEERKSLILRHIRSLQDKYNFDNHPNWGYHTPWWRKEYGCNVNYSYDESYQSNLELDCYKLFDQEKIFYRTNKNLYLPYIHPKDNKIHYYIPDLIIYGDEYFENIQSIVEIKPHEFVINPRNNKTEYYIVTSRKLCALRFHCLVKNIKCIVLTEGDIYNEDKKNKKKEV